MVIEWQGELQWCEDLPRNPVAHDEAWFGREPGDIKHNSDEKLENF